MAHKPSGDGAGVREKSHLDLKLMTSPTLQKILACVAASALLFTGAAVMAAPAAQTRQTTAQTQLDTHYNLSGPLSQRWR